MATLKNKYSKAGCPTKYSQEYGKQICNLIATHALGLNKLIKKYDLPDKQTIFNWLQNHDEFFDQYLRARKFQSHVLADEILDMPSDIPTYYDKDDVERIDSGILGRSKFDFECKKWHASKLEPKVYGEQKQLEDLQVQNNRLLDECKQLRKELDEKNKRDY